MWSKNKLKLVRSLRLKKHRDAEAAFVAEGHKVVGEMAGHFPCRFVAATADFLAHHALPADLPQADLVTERELEQASALAAPQGVIAVFERPAPVPVTAAELDAETLTLVLDGVQDPGNVGTIVRIADWFGISTIVCSPDTADVFAPKVVQATMGALARVSVTYTDLPALLADCPAGLPVYGTFMDGDNLYDAPLTHGGVIVMGNEGKGISPAVAKCVNARLLIPAFPAGRATVESLNVAMATAITVAEFRRRAL